MNIFHVLPHALRGDDVHMQVISDSDYSETDSSGASPLQKQRNTTSITTQQAPAAED